MGSAGARCKLNMRSIPWQACLRLKSHSCAQKSPQCPHRVEPHVILQRPKTTNDNCSLMIIVWICFQRNERHDTRQKTGKCK